ncbi:hypothetical protein F503_00626 [Ophiostoma piceae UAMH 11346]|uniref:Uncharacterized protein n=1 Tax=Ophiostoma piceae (strain UAMH 11346) TaxID=1262450 RepID=S3C2Z3_OPHP1|nr:hypothetical protein F503_00626 [Ophiostoma piceae UAMH 11346]
MEGILHVPPDRGTIIGRAIWKPRYIVVAAPTDAKHRVQPQRQQSNASSTPSLPSLPSLPSIAQNQPSIITSLPRATTPASPSSLSAENMYLSVFKNKGDLDPIQQHAISSITDCQVQMLAHRKQGPILPTLVINVSPDPITDKLRKRRSSRTAGLTTTKDTAPTTLWFRPAEDNLHKQALLEWCRFIQALMLQLGTVMSSASGPLSPITPASPTFVNPFSSSKDRALPAHSHQPPPPPPPPPAQNQTADSPSLRSRRSDLSHTSSNLPPHVTTSGYSTTSSNSISHSHSHYNVPFFQSGRPTDLPSPATTANESQPELAGSVSTISSPSRGRDSVSSPVIPISATTGALTPSVGSNSTSPPVPRETILDRAFQMRFIPGSQREVIPGEEKLSSLARFDALMREAEERKRLRQAVAISDIKDLREHRDHRDLRSADKDIKRSVTTAPYVGRPSRSNSYNHQPQFQPQFQSQFPSTSKPMEPPKSGWDLDEDDDSDDASDSNDEEDDDAEDDEGVHSGDDDDIPHPAPILGRNGRRAESSSTGVCPKTITAKSGVDIAPHRLRALDFIAGRYEPQSDKDGKDGKESMSVTPKARGILAFDAQTLKSLDSGPPRQQLPEALRPQTGYSSRNRPSIAQRTHSQPQLAALNVNNYIANMTSMSRRSHKPSPKSPITPSSTTAAPPLPRAATSSKVDTLEAAATTPVELVKRLSFNDFTKRLSSSTSSLLLVQSNASNVPNASAGSNVSAGSHGSDHGGAPLEQYTTSPGSVRHSSGSRITSPPPPPASVERCGWRSSVNVISTEGGFL